MNGFVAESNFFFEGYYIQENEKHSPGITRFLWHKEGVFLGY